MSIGKDIDNLIMSNIKIWHKDTLLKDSTNSLKQDLKMTQEEKAKIFLEARSFNSERANNKDSIDTYFNCNRSSKKVNYYAK